jgi:hypothetical protein
MLKIGSSDYKYENRAANGLISVSICVQSFLVAFSVLNLMYLGLIFALLYAA